MKHRIRNVTDKVVVIEELGITITPKGMSAVIDETQFKKIVGPRTDIVFVPVFLEEKSAAPVVQSESDETEEVSEATKMKRGRHGRV